MWFLNENDKVGGKCLYPNAVKKVNELIAANNLVDIWRTQHPTEFHFTWKRVKPRIILERIDYILVTDNVARLTKSSCILPAYKSDHSIPTINWLQSEYKRGPGYWKLNISHLENIEYKEEIVNIIRNLSDQYTDIVMRWELIKMAVRGFSIQYGARKSKSTKNKIAALNKKIITFGKDPNQGG